MQYSQRLVCPFIRLLPTALALTLLSTAGSAHETSSQSIQQRVLPAGNLPADRRLGKLKDLNGYFPFVVPPNRQQWATRRESLRRRSLVATGLWPMPAKTPLHAVIRGKVERDGFTVEKVHFESLPGHVVTGLLFRPTGKQGPCPGVLSPHGHGGRLMDHGPQKIRQLIVDGEERFEQSGRFPKLARCAQLARMGCVTFIYDMLGYADSRQIPKSLAHGFRKQRPELDSPTRWGFFSTQAELRLQSIMGLQTWNSIRALDFLCSLPDVDPQRIGVTGGSGGGTQTILLCAIDSRPVVSFPNGMVSTSMQGGCTCENCCLLRLGTGNVELAALFAPKPQGMTAANDWTRDMMTKGYPQLQTLYAMYASKDQVLCRKLTQFHHNYNYVTRATMYGWFNKHLRLGLKDPIVEEDWPLLTAAELSVWDKDHPAPQVDANYEPELLRAMARQSDRQIAALSPAAASPGGWAALKPYRALVGKALETMIGRAFAEIGPIDSETVKHGKSTAADGQAYFYRHALVRAQAHGEEIPVIALTPPPQRWHGHTVVWVDGRGKAALFDVTGQPNREVLKLLKDGIAMVSADLLYQGEFLSDGKRLEKTRVVPNPREAACYTFAYNPTLFSERVHDILTLLKWAREDCSRRIRQQGSPSKANRIDLLGLHGAGPWVAVAAAIADPAGDLKVIDRIAIDTDGFRFAGLRSYRDVNFLPGAVKYGDLPGMLPLLAPHALWIAGETESDLQQVHSAYQIMDRTEDLRIERAPAPRVATAACQWLGQVSDFYRNGSP